MLTLFFGSKKIKNQNKEASIDEKRREIYLKSDIPYRY
ncbi:hypothetical protein BACCIP111883_01380 [Sutcliffiella rhizosphaerae]|uniref:Uncharacterized protein n=1 Tax=Sutcliffiella rhizosphaerae TaxID=2880967 RepID=A0ABM8YKY1_9BACI|nr:hypothetical protein BACCIP111883_01380 [Sutcliffiella rhizosphaerae]